MFLRVTLYPFDTLLPFFSHLNFTSLYSFQGTYALYERIFILTHIRYYVNTFLYVIYFQAAWA
jgi:hypothetical protein